MLSEIRVFLRRFQTGGIRKTRTGLGRLKPACFQAFGQKTDGFCPQKTDIPVARPGLGKSGRPAAPKLVFRRDDGKAVSARRRSYGATVTTGR